MNEIQKTTNSEGLTIDMISSLLWCWWLDQNPFSILTTEKTQRTSSTFNDAFLPKQVTGGHNILADRWAGASNLHPHPYLDPHTQTYTNKYQERSFSHFLTWSLRTNEPTDGWTKPHIGLHVSNYKGQVCSIRALDEAVNYQNFVWGILGFRIDFCCSQRGKIT